MAPAFWVEIVSADRLVWEGNATQLIATTTEGQIGILAHHIPLIATLAPGAAEVTTEDGARHVMAVEGGFISVTVDRTSIIAPYARVADDLNLDQARADLAGLVAKREAGDTSVATDQAWRRTLALVRTAEHQAARHS
jgi:F-type H+-transporting ATPase subunit epsilon